MREQLEQRIEATWPRPFLLRPPALLFFVTVDSSHGSVVSACLLWRADAGLLGVEVVEPSCRPALLEPPSKENPRREPYAVSSAPSTGMELSRWARVRRQLDLKLG